MESVEKIKGLVLDLDINEMAELKHWLLSKAANVFGLADLAEAAEEHGWSCPLDHVEDLEDHEIREMASEIGMVDVEDVRALAEAIAERRNEDALGLLKGMFPEEFKEIPEPSAQLWLAGIRGRAL